MKTYFVDAFTHELFKGNPAGVCLLNQELSEEKMQLIAKEIGFSETAFVKDTRENGIYGIRYFSPKKEIPLCGHATLASSKIIFDKTDLTKIIFLTGENVVLPIKKEDTNIVMSFPVYETTSLTVPSAMPGALGIEQVTKTSYSPQNKIIILEISDAHTLAALKPDFDALVRSYDNINGVLVTAPSNNTDHDFHYRYFWPWAGTNEDPVTGGVQTFLAKYWAEKLNKKKLRAFQPSERTGFMTVELQDDNVLIYGNAVIVLEGDFKIH